MSLWETRDLPVLEALSRNPPDAGFLAVGHSRGAALGLDMDDAAIHQAIVTLGDAGYVAATVDYEMGGGAIFEDLMITGRGQQALGEWPLFTTVSSPLTLALLLEEIADGAPTDEEAANARRAANYVRSLTAGAVKSAAIGASSYVARLALGL